MPRCNAVAGRRRFCSPLLLWRTGPGQEGAQKPSRFTQRHRGRCWQYRRARRPPYRVQVIRSTCSISVHRALKDELARNRSSRRSCRRSSSGCRRSRATWCGAGAGRGEPRARAAAIVAGVMGTDPTIYLRPRHPASRGPAWTSRAEIGTTSGTQASCSAALRRDEREMDGVARLCPTGWKAVEMLR